jgi:PAS domain S-box-containing protein
MMIERWVRRPWASLGLAARVAITAGALLIGTGTVLVILLVRVDGVRFEAKQAGKLGIELSHIATSLAAPVVVGDSLAIQQILKNRVSRRDVTRVSWTDGAGHVLSANRAPGPSKAPKWFADWIGLPDVFGTQLLVTGEKVYGEVSLELSSEEGVGEIWSSAVDRVIVVVIGISLCLSLTLLVLANGLRPFSALVVAASRLRNGDYGARLTVEGPPESRFCIEAFNRMGSDIENLALDLKRAEAELLRTRSEIEAQRAQRSKESELAKLELRALLAERRSVETALRSSESHTKLLGRIVEHASDGVITRDVKGCVTSWNAAATRLFGVSSTQAIGQPLSALCDMPSDHDDMRVSLEQRRFGGTYSFEMDTITREGETLHLQVSVVPILTDEDSASGAVLVFREATKQKRFVREVVAV